MKKILSILGVLIFVSGLMLSSCNSNRLCPAYPPSVYQGDIQQNDNDQSIEFKSIDIQEENL